MDSVTLMTIGLFAVSAIIFYGAYLFTKNLIKQHNDIYPLLYGLEEAEKKKQRGES